MLGDFNATPYAATYRILARGMADARRQARGRRPSPTFPSRFPMLAIDHVFMQGAVKATHAEALVGPLARLASDHLPFVVDFQFS